MRHTSLETWPWVIALSFGLLHGLGFGGALREVRLPHILRIELVHKVDDHLILMRLMIRE